MYRILEAKELTANIYLMVVEAKRVAKACEPGQFVIVRTNRDSERIPLTICDYDRQEGISPSCLSFTSGFGYSSGIMIAASRYTTNPVPTLQMLAISHMILTTVGSTPIYSPKPPHTPQIVRFVLDLNSFL